MKKITKAIIPAAGLGTRLLPVTKAMPKEMLPILNRPTIDYIVEEAIQSGIEQILIVTSNGKSAIENYFDRHLLLEQKLADKEEQSMLEKIIQSAEIDIHYIRQKEPKGLGHAIWCARNFIGNEPFAVLLGDDIIESQKPCLLQMIEQYERIRTPMLAVQEVESQELEKYGVIQYSERLGKQFFISNVVEKPKAEVAPSNLAIIGRYILTPKIFPILEQMIAEVEGEIQLTDAIQTGLAQEYYSAYSFEGERFDVGDVLGYLKTTLHFALQQEDIQAQVLQLLQDYLMKEEKKAQSLKRKVPQ